MAKYQATINVIFHREKEATEAYMALEPDNDEYVEVMAKGNTLICIAKGKNTLSLLASIDDCLSALSLYTKTRTKLEKR